MTKAQLLAKFYEKWGSGKNYSDLLGMLDWAKTSRPDLFYDFLCDLEEVVANTGDLFLKGDLKEIKG